MMKERREHAHGCEIARNIDPTQYSRMSLITRANQEPRWGHCWTRSSTLEIIIFCNEINALVDFEGGVNIAREFTLYTNIRSAAPDHAVRIDTVHRFTAQLTRLADRRRKQRGLACVADAGLGEVFVDISFELVLNRHLVAFAVFFKQAQPPALALWVIILDAHPDNGTHAGEGIGHHANQSAIAQTDQR